MAYSIPLHDPAHPTFKERQKNAAKAAADKAASDKAAAEKTVSEPPKK